MAGAPESRVELFTTEFPSGKHFMRLENIPVRVVFNFGAPAITPNETQLVKIGYYPLYCMTYP